MYKFAMADDTGSTSAVDDSGSSTRERIGIHDQRIQLASNVRQGRVLSG